MKIEDTSPQTAASPLTRWVAALVLIPTVPLLLLSVAALVLFYAAPTRFGSLIARLPGDELIRSMLVFAPATLLAVVVLAVLYAIERPGPSAPALALPAGAPPARLAAGALLVLGSPALLASVAVFVLSFAAPERVDALLVSLPGTPLLRLAVVVAPPLLFAIVLAAGGYLSLSSPVEAGVHRTSLVRRLTGLAASLSLAVALPALGLSLTALALNRFYPARFEALLARLSLETFVRLGLLFAPAVLAAVALLAVLYLLDRRREAPAPPTGPPLRSRLAVAVLAAGLLFTAVFVLGTLGVLLFLILR